ncbi:hypothetical protein ACET3Z_000492 [Daucus carota]
MSSRPSCPGTMALNYFSMVLISTLVLPFLPAAWAQAKPSVSRVFVQCLHRNSLPSHPISQAIYTPENSSYVENLNIYARNLRFCKRDTPKPLAIIAAMHESHVRAAIMCCNKTNLLMRVRSGGHDYEGLSYTANMPFVILDMFNLRSIDIDLEHDTAWVESGALLGELYYRIASMSSTRAFPAGGDIVMQWNPYGGRMDEISENAVPLPQRAGYLFKIQHILYWYESRESHADKYMNESRQFYESMAPYVTRFPREAFLNYRDLDIGENALCNSSYTEAKSYGLKYFKGNFDRLVQVKTRVDPTNFFRNEQSIPPLLV